MTTSSLSVDRCPQVARPLSSAIHRIWRVFHRLPSVLSLTRQVVDAQVGNGGGVATGHPERV
ncbi:hypothetical protein ACWER9_28580, partial [Micromonospora sp. NPDC003944]